jgi:hypothetical protein
VNGRRAFRKPFTLIAGEGAGVMITLILNDREDKDAIYISAKRGLGMRVVEG